MAVTTESARHGEVLARVIGFLEQTFPGAPQPLAPDSPLPDTVLADSLSYLEVVMFLEREFDLSFATRDLEGAAFETPNSIAGLAQRKLGESGR